VGLNLARSFIFLVSIPFVYLWCEVAKWSNLFPANWWWGELLFLSVMSIIIWKVLCKKGDGFNICKHENGQNKSTGRVRFGNKCGVWREWYENGKIKSEGRYRGGKKCGVWKEWHANGKVKSERVFQSPISWTWLLRGGVSYEWYPDGQKKMECHYHDEGKSGVSREWHKSGQMKSEGGYLPCAVFIPRDGVVP
jgi:hypothetical protein